MKKNIAIFIYVPLLALMIAVTGFLLFYKSAPRQSLKEEQIINLDELFLTGQTAEENVQAAEEQNVVLPDTQTADGQNVLLPDTQTADGQNVLLPDSQGDAIAAKEGASASGAFVLGVVDDHVAVFESGETEVYMYTGILLENLPDSTQSEVLAGKEIADEEALYFFLETYSS
ncbi:MAG: hypothetical protein LUC90_01355 [Lachnospiraceae bacterium]|nr:hypothetical protein [Lachnospiraceae bacterium]